MGHVSRQSRTCGPLQHGPGNPVDTCGDTGMVASGSMRVLPTAWVSRAPGRARPSVLAACCMPATDDTGQVTNVLECTWLNVPGGSGVHARPPRGHAGAAL